MVNRALQTVSLDRAQSFTEANGGAESKVRSQLASGTTPPRIKCYFNESPHFEVGSSLCRKLGLISVKRPTLEGP
jgi:hypothetical protein